MLAVVKTPHIEIRGENLPTDLLDLLRGYFKAQVEIVEDPDETVDWFETDLHKRIEAQSTPGTIIRAFRRRDELTQGQLAEKLGVSKQVVCDLEKERRTISAATAKKLSEIFKTRLETWL
jgi:DNA-binding XRE family transcriptional regulator